MKKTVTTMLVIATVFLCSFNVYASTVDPSPMVYTTDTKSYLDGDLQVFTIAEIDNAVMTEYGAHTTSNILQGTTHDFYYDADYVWDAPMQVSVNVRNNSNKYIVIPNGALYNNWTMTYTDYSNNGSGTQGSALYLGYYIEDNLGVVYQTTSSPSVILKSDDMFYADDIIIEPGQNKTYQYTVHFCFKAWTHNNANIYDPFDCNISVTTSSVVSGINDAYESTINDFINDDDIPYSVIAYLNALVNQGIEDQELYNDILVTLATKHSDFNLFGSGYNNLLISSQYASILTTPTINSRLLCIRPYIIHNDIEVNDISGGSVNSAQICYPFYFIFRVFNNTDNTYKLNKYAFTINLTSGTLPYQYLGNEIDIVYSDGITIGGASANNISFNINNDTGSNAIIPSYADYYCIVRINYIFSLGSYSSTDDQISYQQFSITQSYNDTVSSSLYNTKWYESIPKNFADIRDLLIGNKQNNDDISDQVADNQAQEDVIHAQEEQWYQDNEDAITAVGLSNYQFSGNQTAGLSGVTSQFTAVWNALDGWTNIYIFVLTLSLAAFILRHNPFTRRQQNYSDRPKGEST